jgi:hypothetical protein
LRLHKLNIVIKIDLENRSQHVHLPTVNVKLTNELHLQAKLALTPSPLLDSIECDHSHYPSSTWLHDNEPILLHSHPSSKLIIVLNEDIAFEEMCIESFTLREDVQDLLSCFYFIEMTDFIVML